jgi:hypothetical protein
MVAAAEAIKRNKKKGY